MSGQIYYVPLGQIKLDYQSYEAVRKRDVEAQIGYLEERGMIEPLFARQSRDGRWVVDNSDWPYAVAQVIAAMRLEYDTIIITDSTESD